MLENSNRPSMRGRMITVEGIDGAGKSIVTNTIISEIEANEISVVATREPGGTNLGESLRKLLLANNSEFSPEAEILAIFAARAQHLHEFIRPKLAAGNWVLSDRFTDSTYAYQGGGRNISFDKIRLIENWVQRGFRPHITILLDADIETGRARVLSGNGALDRFEMENDDFHSRVRKAYREIARKEPERVKVVDASQTKAQMRAETRRIIREFIGSQVERNT